MKIPNELYSSTVAMISLARIVSEDSQHEPGANLRELKSSKDS